MKTNIKAWALLNLVGFIGTIIVNALAITLPINNRTTQELSDFYPNLFVPIGLTFSIWSIIYLLLLIFIVHQLRFAFRKSSNPRNNFIDKIGPWFLISCVANMLWIIAWHYEIVWLSLLIMFCILGSLIAIYESLEIGRSSAKKEEKVLVHIAFSVYLGWISIATIANFTALLVNYKWGGFGIEDYGWAIALIAIGAGLGLRMLTFRKDIFYALVVAWAFYGIYLKQSMGTETENLYVTYAALGFLSLILIGTLVVLVFQKGTYLQREN